MIRLTLEDPEMDYLASLLAQRPLAEALPLWEKIRSQVQTQREAPQTAPGSLNGHGVVLPPLPT